MPSLFDVLVCGILAVPFLKTPFREVFFIFYSILILSFSLFCKQKREFRSWGLAVLVSTALVGVFVHSYSVSAASVTFKYLNLYLMSEGFIYILFGALLLTTAVRYGKNLNCASVLIPVAAYPVLKYMVESQQYTLLLASLLALVGYLVVKGRPRWALGILLPLLMVAVLKHEYLLRHFACRPEVWGQMIRSVSDHPWVGIGFNHYLTPDNMVFCHKLGLPYYGWIYAQNDYLNLAMLLGVPALAGALWFTGEALWQARRTWRVVLVAALAVTSCFQITMFQLDKASIILVILAWAIVQSKNKEEK
jgi:hypothetical protein